MTPISILIGALGGQGGGVLAEWIVDAAVQAGYVAQGTSIPGVAQRTGATTYYVEIHPEPRATLGGRVPVLGLYPVPGHVDLVVASELLEAGRLVQAGHVSAERTLLVASTSRTLTTAEKMVPGDGRFDAERLLAVARANSRRLCAFDMDAAARSAGTVVSAVMLGAIAGSGVVPIARGVFEDVVRASGVGVAASLRGFAGGHAAVASHAAAASPSTDRGSAETASRSGLDHAGVLAGGEDEAAGGEPMRLQGIPDGAAAMVALGHARVVEFQDAAYGELYLARLRSVAIAERAADPAGVHDGAIVRETARFLALWMAFDDIVRVADLKTRRSRFARVAAEVSAAPGDVLRIVDHFKPGVPEVAGLLPRGIATRLVRHDRARQARGREPLAFAMRLRTDSVCGFVLLRTLAALRPLRRLGLRYSDEQQAIERWLAAVTRGCAADWRLGHEIALCGRLVKGYGATNERGKATLAHILAHVADGGEPPAERAAAVRAARDAALADGSGAALDATLVRHGAPPRPVPIQPITWQRRPAARATTDSR